MLSEEFRALLKSGAKDFNIDLSEEMLDKFSTYAGLLVEWNEKNEPYGNYR